MNSWTLLWQGFCYNSSSNGCEWFKGVDTFERAAPLGVGATLEHVSSYFSRHHRVWQGSHFVQLRTDWKGRTSNRFYTYLSVSGKSVFWVVNTLELSNVVRTILRFASIESSLQRNQSTIYTSGCNTSLLTVRTGRESYTRSFDSGWSRRESSAPVEQRESSETCWSDVLISARCTTLKTCECWACRCHRRSNTKSKLSTSTGDQQFHGALTS